MKVVRCILILAVLVLAFLAAWLIYLIPWVCLFAAVFVAIIQSRKGFTFLTSHGTARWATEADLKCAGMIGADKGLILGRAQEAHPSVLRAVRNLFDRRVKAAVACTGLVMAIRQFNRWKAEGELIRLPQAVHTAVFAPTGVGKGVSIILPFLKASTESAVVLDFKGENAALTADERRKLGHKVVILDPFTIATKTPDTFNPLDAIDKDSPHALDDCRDLANALVITTGQEKDPHFTESAKVWLTAFIAAVVQNGDPSDRSLQTVKDALCDPEYTKNVIKMMCDSKAWGGLLARMGGQLKNYKDKELASTLTTTLRFLQFLDTPAISASTRSSTFDPAELTKGKMTVYLVLPPEKMRGQMGLLRLWVGATLRAAVRGGLQETNRVHFVLDEAASLGSMESIDDAISVYRGYGVRIQFYYQSTGQLKACFPADEGQTLLSNTTQVYFGVNDKQTADYVSERLGEATIVVDSGGSNDGDSRSTDRDGAGSSSFSRGRSSNWAQQARRLLKPEEVTALPPRIAITFQPGIPPLWTNLTRWYEQVKPANGRLRRFLRNLEITTAAIFLLALSLGLAWAMTQFTNHPQGSPHGAVRQQGNRR